MTPGDIPAKQRGAAASFGKLVAQGIIESKDAVESLFVACLKYGYAGDEAGLRTRLWWIVRDSAEVWRMERIKAEYKIRSAITPLMQSRSDARSILRAAYAANEAVSEPFLRREVLEFVNDEMRSFMAGAQKGRRAYGR